VQQPAKFVPVRDYLKTQRRFAAMSDAEIEAIQARVDADWEKLLGRASDVHTLKY
jgi:pyruvate ferredoxin oxidoreductase beta subunit